MRYKILTTFLLSFSFVFLFGQDGLQSPDEFLPHKLGEHFTPHYMRVDYFQHVAENSDHVQLIEYGMTNQKRPLQLAFVSTPENLASLESIRENNLKRAKMMAGEADESNPIPIVWLSFGVHGNEAGASESSMQSIYELLTNEDAKKWLENTVVIIDPCINPDGNSRYTHWNRNIGTLNADPTHIAREHDEPWPGGRVNHYHFDLNRDWAWATQVETQQRMKHYQKWMPHIHADFHEQFHNEPYYFAPAAQPYHTYITDWQADFQTEIGKNHAKYFDKEGWLYYTKEVFDLFYPSYGDTYPTFNGAIGMTYEQAGHGFSGRSVLMETGDTLTLKDRIDHHKTTALSTVEIASINAKRVTEKFAAYFEKSLTNPPGEYKTFVIKGSNPDHKLKAITDLLDIHKIDYGSVSANVSIPAFDYALGKDLRHEVTPEDLVISAYQAKGLLTQVLFEPFPELVDSLTYDITAWSLIYAHGLEAYATNQRVDPSKKFELPSYRFGINDKEPYAYVATWSSFQNAKFLGAILQKGVKVRYAEEAFSLEGRNYDAGTLIITKADNRKNPNYHRIVQKTAADFEQEIYSVKTGFVDSGSDFGSDKMTYIEAPKIAVLSGESTYGNEFGQVWHFFEQFLEYPITNVDADRLSRLDLDNYNLIVFPEGRYRISDDLAGKLSSWMADGGRIIAIGAANSAFEDKSGFNLTKYAKDSDKSAAKKAREAAALKRRTMMYHEHARSFIPYSIPGAIFELKMDNSHPLAFGIGDQYFTLKTSSRRYDLLKNTWNVGYIEKDAIISGFVGSELKGQLSNSVSFAVQDKGRGSITYMIDNPLYRGFWEEGKFLMSNAIFFVGQ